jgi:1-acyl-sn-glycerol-3-phosphate acyltransferase
MNEIIARLRAFLAIIISFFNTLWLGLLVIVLGLIPIWGRNLIFLWAKLFIWIMAMDIEYIFKGGQLPENAIYMANHQSFVDSVLVFNKVRRAKFIIFNKFKNLPVFGQALIMQGHLFIKQGQGREAIKTINQAITKLKNGLSLIIFPEGQRNEHLGKFQKGGFKMAQKTLLPIVPISISGSFLSMPKGKLKFYKRKIRVVFHPILETREYTDQNLNILMDRVKRIIAGALQDFELEADQRLD